MSFFVSPHLCFLGMTSIEPNKLDAKAVTSHGTVFHRSQGKKKLLDRTLATKELESG